MKTILSFDGGGTRGAISLAFLKKIEEIYLKGGMESLASKIDLAGGTSTGAIIAGTLALGYSVEDIREFYFKLAPKVFRRSKFRLPGVQSIFHAKPLKQEILRICGDRTLDSSDLLTGFALVMKRMDSGSTWILSNNPNSKYWNDPEDGSYLGNRHYKLANIIRASTAAPHYFAPELIHIADNEPPGLFVDGGVTPHNNPSLALLQLATIPVHGFGWQTGLDKLRIISIGTGTFRVRLNAAKARRMTSVGLAIKALAGMIYDSEMQTLQLMQLLGHSKTPWKINSEIGDLAGIQLGEKPLFDFIRYDVRLEKDWLKTQLNIKLRDAQIEQLRKIDNPSMISLAYEVGTAAAEKFVQVEHVLNDH